MSAKRLVFLLLLLATHGCNDAANAFEHAEAEDAGSGFDLPESGADASGPSSEQQPTPSPIEDASSDARADATAPDAGGEALPPRSSFASAQRMEADGFPALVDERSADQVDHFVFHGLAGHYYEIATDNDVYSPDNVLVLYDAQRTVLAKNDEGWIWPGDQFDTRLVVRLPADADYFVTVEDPYTPAEFFGQSFALLYYHLTIREVTPSTPGFGAPGAPLAFEAASGPNYRYLTVIGEAKPGHNTLVFEGVPDYALIAQVQPGGPNGSGSTLNSGLVNVTDVQGRRLAEIDRSKDQAFFRPPLAGGIVTVSLDVSGALGDNPFYAIDLVLLKDNPAEQNEAANGTMQGAEQVQWSHQTAGRALLLSRLPHGDTDYYAVSGKGGQLLGFGCEGETTGSGVRGLHADLVDTQQHVLASMLDESGDLASYALTQDGPVYLRLSSDTPPATADSVDAWTRCVLRLQ
jgi:hypothetical protein